jgi:hypothetical protein
MLWSLFITSCYKLDSSSQNTTYKSSIQTTFKVRFVDSKAAFESRNSKKDR